MPKGRKFKTKQELIDAVISQRSSRKSFGFGSSDSLQSDLDIIENLTDGEFENASGFVETTYSELVNDINTSSLSKGVWYGFDYQTIHVIPGSNPIQLNNASPVYDNGTGVPLPFTPEVEHIYVLALSENTIHVDAVSANYPMDIIHYDYKKDRIALEGTHTGATASRPGFITYRKDTINNIEAGFDFRNVLVRRYHLDNSYDFTSDLETYIGNDTLKGRDTLFNFTAASTNYVPAPDLYYKSDDYTLGGFTAGSGLIKTGSDEYRDFKVLTPVVGQGEYGSFSNISIGVKTERRDLSGSGFVNPALTNEEELLDIVSNVLIRASSAFDIKIGDNNDGITLNLDSLQSIYIEDSNKNIYIGSTDLLQSPSGTPPEYSKVTIGLNEQIYIGSFNTNIAITSHMNDIRIKNSNTGIYIGGAGTIGNRIGDNNTNLFIISTNYIDISDKNTNVFLHGGTNTKIEDSNTDLWINGSMSSITTFTIGSTNNNIRLYYSEKGSIGNNCSNIKFRNSNSIEVKDNVYSIYATYAAGTIIERDVNNIVLYKAFDNIIKEGCHHIQINGDNNVVGPECTYILLGYESDNNIIGAESLKTYITASNNNTLGRGSTDNILRYSFNNILGDQCTGNFFESANDNVLGDMSTDNIFSDVGLRWKYDNLYLFFSSTNLVGAPDPQIMKDIGPSIQTLMTATPDPVKPGPQKNVLGFKTSEVYAINGASGNVVGDFSTDIRLGVADAISAFSLNHTFGNGQFLTLTGAVTAGEKFTLNGNDYVADTDFAADADPAVVAANIAAINFGGESFLNQVTDEGGGVVKFTFTSEEATFSETMANGSFSSAFAPNIAYIDGNVRLGVSGTSSNKINSHLTNIILSVANCESNVINSSFISTDINSVRIAFSYLDFLGTRGGVAPLSDIIMKNVRYLSPTGDLYYEVIDDELDLTLSAGGVQAGESFTINGVTFTENVEFVATQDPTADATAIAGADYSSIEGLTVTNPSAGVVRFTFGNVYTYSEGFANGSFAQVLTGTPKLIKIV